MSVKVEIPTPMREQAGGQNVVEVEGGTVGVALANLVEKYPDLKAKIFDGDRIRPFINVYVNDEDIRYLDEMDTKVTDGQLVVLIPSVAGG